MIYVLVSTIYLGCSLSKPEPVIKQSTPNETNSKEKTTNPNLAGLPEVDQQSVWKYITKDNPYKNWNTFPIDRIPKFAIWKDNYIIPTPKVASLAGKVGRIYLNDIAFSALNDKPRNLPYGSIIIVEISPIQDKNVGEPWIINGRYKVKGSTNRDNDWVIFGYNSSGQLYDVGFGPVFGTNNVCYSCHELSKNDYLWIDSDELDQTYAKVPLFEDCKPR